MLNAQCRVLKIARDVFVIRMGYAYLVGLMVFQVKTTHSFELPIPPRGERTLQAGPGN